jgi:hypothetical protein
VRVPAKVESLTVMMVARISMTKGEGLPYLAVLVE